MRKFNKIIAGVVTTALVATLAIGVDFGAKAKAEAQNILTGNWTNVHENYEFDKDGNPGNDAKINDTVVDSTADRIEANITMTGWQAEGWAPKQPYTSSNIKINDVDGDYAFFGDNPYQLRSEQTVSIVPGTSYTLNFTIDNKMMVADTYKKTEKNVTVSVNSGKTNDFDNVFLSETVKLAPNEVKSFSFDFTIPDGYALNRAKVTFAYGTYSASYCVTEAVKATSEGKSYRNMPAITDEQAKADNLLYAYPTTETNNAWGILTISDISMLGEPGVVFTTDAPATTKAPEVTTKAPEVTTAAPTPEVTTAAPAPVETTVAPVPAKKAFKQVTGVSAKSTKKGKVTVTWKKVAKAKKYAVKIGKKTYKSSKAKITKKAKSGKTVKVKVRALAAAGFKAGKWSKAVKVKVK